MTAPPARWRAALAARRPLLALAPTTRLAIAVALLAPLWAVPGLGPSLLAPAALALVLVAVAVDVVMLPGRRHVDVEREAPPSVGIGDHEKVTYTVRADWPRAVRAELTDTPAEPLGGGAHQAELRVPAWGGGTIEAPLVAMKRGRHPLAPIGVRLHGPLGLVVRRVVYRPDQWVVVTPSIASVRRYRLLAMQERLHTVGVRALRRRGEGRAFAGLRDYVTGDDPRLVDWKATARRQKLITREFTIEQSQTVLVLVDAGRSMTQLAGEFSRFEHALSAALVLTDVAARAGDHVGAVVFDDQVRAAVPPHRGRAALKAIRDALIPVSATLAEPDYATAFRWVATRQRKRALIVFITDVIDVRASRSMLAQLARGATRHLVVAVALRNDALHAAADRVAATAGLVGTAAPVPATRLYEAAAAEELLAAREEALERMRRAGVTVLDVSPQHMTAAVVNRYLELKARGAI